MANPSVPPDFIKIIQSIQKRLDNLESRNASNNMTIRTTSEQRGLNVINEDDVEVVRIGKVQDGDDVPDELLLTTDFDSDGIAVFDGSTSDPSHPAFLWVDHKHGVILPQLAHPWKKPLDLQSVTSGTFADVYMAKVYVMTSAFLGFECILAADSATTGEAIVTMNGTQIGSTQSIAANSINYYNFRYEHGQPMNDGTQWNFAIQLRRTSGAGSVHCYEPNPLTIGAQYSLPVGGWAISA